jgi:hypothetical protein
MFTLTEMSRSAQRVTCLFIAAAIVALSFAASEKSSDSAKHQGYSVSVIELQ